MLARGHHHIIAQSGFPGHNVPEVPLFVENALRGQGSVHSVFVHKITISFYVTWTTTWQPLFKAFDFKFPDINPDNLYGILTPKRKRSCLPTDSV